MVLNSDTPKMMNFDPLHYLTSDQTKQALLLIKNKYQFDLISITQLGKPITLEFYKQWLNQKLNADMDYLAAHLTFKEHPQKINSLVKSAITVAFHYFPTPEKLDLDVPARIALYAKNQDYHIWLKNKLISSIEDLKAIYPNEVFIPFVDSGPVHERDLAYKSGLGWFGKNTCMIHPKQGSLLFLAEILTSIEAQDEIPLQHDLCGACTKCIEICPTQALTPNKVLNANLCISYLTIESKSVPPIELRNKIGDWFFGCDLCQTVCPWNQKKLKLHPEPTISNEHILHLSENQTNKLEAFLKNTLISSNKQLQKKYWGTALSRAGGFGLKKNALIVIANRKLTKLLPEVEKYIQHPKLGELAKWTLQQLVLN